MQEILSGQSSILCAVVRDDMQEMLSGQSSTQEILSGQCSMQEILSGLVQHLVCWYLEKRSVVHFYSNKTNT